MAVTFQAKVVGDIPARRLCVLGGRDDNNVINIRIADRESAADFVSVQDMSDGDIVSVTLKDGYNVWMVETAMDVEAGQWVSCREDGKVGLRIGDTVEDVGFTLEPAREGQAAKIVRRESYNNTRGLEINEKLIELENRINELESGSAPEPDPEEGGE